MWGFADMPEEYQRQYYLDNNMIDELKWMDEDE